MKETCFNLGDLHLALNDAACLVTTCSDCFFIYFFNSYIKRGCNWIVHDVAYKTLVDSFSCNNADVLSD
ncbi:hypothetical protein NC653_023026 [Populus alba x Populus x berolinensis]|uniref:Uncharacterized protein n=1 Tax=Populus alba x Populus x berolinensis TaxID=444605 RepID=A0AAD6MGE1_9ROSI|nr:hypothetical protein NC653_023026 [Populus alba x Populus x berolinensis]